MNVAIIKYNAGNTQSVVYALNRLGIDPVISDEPEVLKSADKVIFPGVGEASTAMEFLRRKKLESLLPRLTQPFLGICLGLQLMCSHSEENNTTGLNIFPVKVKRVPALDKVPHMGWNALEDLKGNLFNGIAQESYVYFVHSYYAELSEFTVATTNYICPFSASLNYKNFYAVQFHTEKSSLAGAGILINFIEL
jgi:glutamine amidotransferase